MNSLYTTAPNTPPTIGRRRRPTEKNFRDTIIGPRTREGFAAPPLTGPATSTHAPSVNPMHTAAAAPEPQGVGGHRHDHEHQPEPEPDEHTSMTKACRSLEPEVGAVAPSCATVRACEP